MDKRIYFNAFHMNCVVHQSPGLWVRVDDKMHKYTDLGTWVELAKLLERGKFDALFLADVVGVYDVYRGNREAAVTQASSSAHSSRGQTRTLRLRFYRDSLRRKGKAMRTIETTATVTNDGKITVQVPPDILPGEHRVVVVIDEQLVKKEKRPPLDFPVDDWELWPGDLPMKREDMHKGGTN